MTTATKGRLALDEARTRYHELRSSSATRARRHALRTYGLRVIAELARHGKGATDLARKFGVGKWTYDQAFDYLLELEGTRPRCLLEVLDEAIQDGRLSVPAGTRFGGAR